MDVVIFGAGTIGLQAYRVYTNEGYGVKYFIDNNQKFWGKQVNGIPVIGLEKYIGENMSETIIIATQYYSQSEIEQQLLNAGLSNYQIYDWLIFYELDEYIHLSNYTNVKPFLNLPRFKHCEVIYLNLICHTDNNLIYYDNRSLAERFPRTVPKYKKGGYRLEIKSILRGHIPNIEITNNHLLSTDLHNCNGYGNKNRYYYKTYSNQNDYKNYYIDHYYSKSTEEFIEKLNKGDVYLDTLKYVMQRVDKYFTQSEITKEKIDFIENKTGLNLSLYRSKVKK